MVVALRREGSVPSVRLYSGKELNEKSMQHDGMKRPGDGDSRTKYLQVRELKWMQKFRLPSENQFSLATLHWWEQVLVGRVEAAVCLPIPALVCPR